MHPITLTLVLLIALLQYPLWFSKNSWLKMWEQERQLSLLQQENMQIQARNALLDAEVRDLKQGTAAIEERARSELGMVRQDEIFFQLLDSSDTNSQ